MATAFARASKDSTQRREGAKRDKKMNGDTRPLMDGSASFRPGRQSGIAQSDPPLFSITFQGYFAPSRLCVNIFSLEMVTHTSVHSTREHHRRHCAGPPAQIGESIFLLPSQRRKRLPGRGRRPP